MVRIHYLQHVPFEGLGSIATWVLGRNYPLSATKLYADEPLPPLAEVDWVVVLGGPMNIYEEQRYPWLVAEKKFLEQAIAHRKTVLGICLGAQLLADVLGAKVYPAPHKEIGWYPLVKTGTAPVLESIPQEFLAFHWHGDTFDLPDGAIHLARSAACANQAFIYQDRVLALQCHLESTRASVEQLVTHCADELAAGTYIQTPEELLGDGQKFLGINQAMDAILNRLAGL
jgi:GMP synthase (glutamine-hydrolysing)